MDEKDQRYRQKSENRVVPMEPYEKIKNKREEIKESTNKVNCFVDENEPKFINTMSRTMDAFDVRMSTFGGK